jgi:hypothetical protein
VRVEVSVRVRVEVQVRAELRTGVQEEARGSARQRVKEVEEEVTGTLLAYYHAEELVMSVKQVK